MEALDKVHHVAVAVSDIAASLEWYRQHFRCEVVYRDDTWALLKFANVNLALVLPQQHPPHLGFIHPGAEQFGPLTPHRDGTRSIYLKDPDGNDVEMLAPHPALEP